MMQKFILLFVALFFSACATMKVTSDYAPQYDFQKIKTFAVAHKTKPSEDGLTNQRIITALKETLQKKGFKEVSKDEADIVFLFHLNIQNKTEVYTDYQMVGYGRRGMVIAVPSTYNYDEGKLIIDGYDPKRNKTIYRAVVVDELKEKKNPKERQEYILEVVQEELKNFPPTKKTH
jgi:hypothetical protein